MIIYNFPITANGEVVPQPRQPTNLQGLLRFCMDATKAEDAPHESQFEAMSEEVRKIHTSVIEKSF